MSSILKFENSANDFLSVLDNVIDEKLKRIDDTILCRIRQANDNGTYNVTVEPDERNVVTGVGNILLDDLKEGDYVWVYRIGQNFTNSFIIYKIGYNVNISNFKNTVQATVYGGGGGGESSDITIVSGDSDGQIKVIEGTYSYNVNVKGLKGNAYTDTPIPTVYIQDASYADGTLTITPHGGTPISVRIPTDKTYDFTNNFMSAWTINHNMNKFPHVTVVRVYIDSTTGEIVNTEEVIGAVKYLDMNNIQITFENEIKGYAYLN